MGFRIAGDSVDIIEYLTDDPVELEAPVAISVGIPAISGQSATRHFRFLL